MAREALPRQVPIQPVAARPRLVDEHERRRSFRLELPDQLVDVALPSLDRPQRHDLRAAGVRRVGDGDRLLVHIEPHVQDLARLAHG